MALKFILIKAGIGYDITDTVQKVTWSGRKNSPARNVRLVILDDPDLGEENRTGIDVAEGHHLIMQEDSDELFRGIIMSQERNQNRELTITAYDNAIYLTANKGSFKYSKKTATQIFLDVCKRFGISRGQVAQTTYKIPSLVDVNTTIYDILINALSKTYIATGERYYILSKKGQLNLLRRREQVTKLVLETGSEGSQYGNITAYSYRKSITETKTRLKLISESGKTMAQWADRDLEKKIGMMEDVQSPDDSLPKKKLKTQVITMLNELKKPSQSLSVTALGISSIISGTAVYISIPEIGVGRTYYVDSDSHDWDGDYHTMKLTLNYAAELEQINDDGNVEVTNADDSSAVKAAQQAIKDAAKALKEKKAVEKIIVTAGKKAERAANTAESALKAARRAYAAYEKAVANAAKAKTAAKAASYMKSADKQLVNAAKQAQKVIDQEKIAQTEYEKSKVALADAKALYNAAQSDLTSTAEFAVQQADSSARRASEYAEEAKQYLQGGA